MKQIPLNFEFESANRVALLLTVKDSPEASRLMKLLLRWARIYGMVNINIHMNKEVIIIGEDSISMTDCPVDVLSTITDQGTPASHEHLFHILEEKNLVSTQTWMNLYALIPGAGAEKSANLLSLLGHEKTSQGRTYWTKEHIHTLNKYNWVLHIHTSPSRHHQQIREVACEKDIILRDFGDGYVFFSQEEQGFVAHQREHK